MAINNIKTKLRGNVKMKKTIILFLVLAISIISLSGCNANNQSNKSDTESNDTIKTNPNTNDKLVVLFRGITLDEKDTKVNILNKETDSSKKQELYSKYEREYYLYSNGAFLGKANGKIEGRGLDYYWNVIISPDQQYEVALSKQYNPYPRQMTLINSNFPKEFNIDGKVFKSVNNQFNVSATIRELYKVDIDGDNKDEYIALAVDEQSYFFAKCLIDSDLNVAAYLTVFKGKPKYGDFQDLLKNYNLKDSGEIIDINNDGVMELLLRLPSYEGFNFKVFTYKNKVFDGAFITKASIDP